MRFRELTLDRFGAIEASTLTFADHCGLTVVYGANEAGKSTSLAAVGDFLFGVPQHSPHVSLFGVDALRIGATLVKADGEVLSLRRRKGRVRTLTTADGDAVEDTMLGSVLGGTTRDRFETLFGLDHQRLRTGGAQLLSAQGDIGRLIVEAGGGLKGLMERLERIDEELDRLFDTRRSERRAFYRALDAFTDADRAVKAGLVSVEAYVRAKQVVEDAEVDLKAVTEAEASLTAEISRLGRLIRVAPVLRTLDQARAQLVEIERLGDLPATFDADVDTSQTERGRAAAALLEAEARHQDLETRMAGLVADPRIIARETDIRDIAERAIHVAKAREDRDNRLNDLDDSNQQLDSLRARLGLSVDTDLAERLPSAIVVEKVGALAAEAVETRASLSAAEGRGAEGAEDVSRLEAVVDAGVAAGRGVAIGVSLTDLTTLPGLVQAWEARRRNADELERQARAEALALGFRDIEALEATPFPTAAAIGQETTQREAIASARTRLAEQRVAAEATRARAQAEVTRQSAGATPASDEALSSARAERAAALAPLRSAHLAGDWPTDAQVRLSEVTAADLALQVADGLADRHAAEAQRVAALTQAASLLEAAGGEIVAIDTAFETFARQHDARVSAFVAAFPNAAEIYPELPSLAVAEEQRRVALKRWRDAGQLRLDAQADEVALSEPLQRLEFAERICGLTPLPQASVTDRVGPSVTAIADRERAHSDHLRDVEALKSARAAHQNTAVLVRQLQNKTVAWSEAWTPALAALGLGEDTPVDEAAATAIEWAAARGVLTTIEATRRRLSGMDRDEAELAERVRDLGAALNLVLPSDAVAAAKMLSESWRDHEDRRRRHEELEPDLQVAVQALGRAKALAEACHRRLLQLAQRAGVSPEDTDALAAVGKAYTGYRILIEEIAALLSTLARAGDGVAEADLRAAWLERDPDVLKGELRAAELDLAKAAEERGPKLEALLNARGALAAYEDQGGANTALTERESATTELHEIVERYVELSLARDLLREAIDKVRAEQQDPLILRAGVLFQAMTRDAYDGVGADIDQKGEPIVVGRQGARTVSVSEMSDGTRDQLFLAFRLAALENYCATAEPLPFIADDILVHFDDPRSEATLSVLADFAATTQVLLFTHHESIKAAADALALQGRAHVVSLN